MSLSGGGPGPISWQRRALYWGITALLGLVGTIFFVIELLQGTNSRQVVIGLLCVAILLTSIVFIARTVRAK